MRKSAYNQRDDRDALFFKTASKSMIVTYRYYWRLELQVIEVEPASELDVPSAWKCQL